MFSYIVFITLFKTSLIMIFLLLIVYLELMCLVFKFGRVRVFFQLIKSSEMCYLFSGSGKLSNCVWNTCAFCSVYTTTMPYQLDQVSSSHCSIPLCSYRYFSLCVISVIEDKCVKTPSVISVFLPFFFWQLWLHVFWGYLFRYIQI
jgi:hypothetical protein